MKNTKTKTIYCSIIITNYIFCFTLFLFFCLLNVTYIFKIKELAPQNNQKAKRMGGQVAQLINYCKIDLTIITIF